MNLSKLSGIAAMVALIAMIVCTDLLHPDLATAQDKYGAIAFGTTSLRWGYSYNYPNREGAEERALAECKSEDCEIVVWFKNSCGALARSREGDLGYAWSSTRERAEQIALDECRARGSECSVVCWACTER